MTNSRFVNRILLLASIIIVSVNTLYAKSDFPDISSTSFSNQQVCLHHDNFHRQILDPQKPWHVGTNDPKGKSMNYYSPFENYDEVDDGFRLVSNVLTNDQDVKGKSIRFIESTQQAEKDFFVELSKVKQVSHCECLVFNFIDIHNYDMLFIQKATEEKDRISIILVRDDITKKVISKKVKAPLHLYRFQSNDESIRLMADDDVLFAKKNAINRRLNKISVNRQLPMGLYIDNTNVYEYSFVNVFNVREFKTFEQKLYLSENENNTFNHAPKIIDENKYTYQIVPQVVVGSISREHPSAINSKNGERYYNSKENRVYEYNSANGWGKIPDLADNSLIYCISTGEIYSYNKISTTKGRLTLQAKETLWSFGSDERLEYFELRKEDVTNSLNDRSENTEVRFVQTNLRKRIYSFDVFLPSDYFDNVSGGEAIMQLQLRPDLPKESRVPAFTISTELRKGIGRWHTNVRSIPTKYAKDEKIKRHDDIDLGVCALGQWTHWEVIMKEGYMDDHMPMVVIKKNNKVVFESNEPNTWNTVQGLYIRYGIYKSTFLPKYSINNSDSKRRLYICNFKYVS